MSDSDRERIEQIDARQEFTQLEDGFLYYFPKSNGVGFSSYNLRIIADECQ